jgi:RNA polymerase sigma-70 factor (ECF subfamily)
LSKPEKLRLDPDRIDVRLLIRQAQAGDKKAFEELVIIYQDKVYTLSYYLAGNHSDAQDLAQEVFLKAYSSLRSFRLEADLGTWLHRITVNTWSNMRRGRNQVLSLDDPLQTEDGEMERPLADGDPTSDPAVALEEKEVQVMVQHAIRSLPEEYRAVLVLREMEGYTYEEIAGIMGCSLGTVKSRLNRARRALKEKILRPVDHCQRG